MKACKNTTDCNWHKNRACARKQAENGVDGTADTHCVHLVYIKIEERKHNAQKRINRTNQR